MHIAQVFPEPIPPAGYGGSARVVYWLSRELVRQGHRVTVLADARSRIEERVPGVELVPISGPLGDVRPLLPAGLDVVHFHDAPPLDALPDRPFLVTEHGNRRKFAAYAPNTVFLSASHARNHGAKLYVHNGVPKDEYPLCLDKRPYMLFMAKLAWRKKNAKTAIRLSLDSGFPLTVAGGDLWRTRKIWGLWMLRALWRRHLLHGVGEVGGAEKLRLLQEASLLFYMVNWQEPFALAPHEAMACGTPVLATPNGALGEYIEHGRNGFLVSSYGEALRAVRQVAAMSSSERRVMAEYCRESAFSAQDMARDYVKLYERLLVQPYLYPPEEAAGFHFRRPRSVCVH